VSLNPFTLVVESVPAFTRSTSWLEKKYTDEHSEFVEVRDSRIHYRSEGNEENQTLVLLHGTFSSLHTWDGWVEQLKDEYHLVRLDMPGFGLTGPREKDEHRLEYLVNTVGEFCETLELEDIVVVGNSLGGGVAWRLATWNPDLARGAILIDAGGGTLLCRILDSLTTPLISQLGVSRLMARMVLNDAYGSKATPSTETVRRYHDLVLRPGNRRAARELSRNFRRDHPDACGEKHLVPTPPSFHEPSPNLCDPYCISDMGIPVLFQWGEEDDWLPPSFGRELSARVQRSTFIAYEDIGHLPMEEAPAETAADARQFIQQIETDGVEPQIPADD